MSEQTLGNSLRFLGQQKRVTLRALAARTDFTASFISKIENGQCSPSISSMEKIANALDEFFLSANKQVVNIVRSGDRVHRALDWSRAEIASLGSLPGTSQFQAFMISIRPGGITGKRARPSISDEFAMVFEGSVILKLEDKEQTLERGDAATLVAGTGRQWRNEIARLDPDPDRLAGPLSITSAGRP